MTTTQQAATERQRQKESKLSRVEQRNANIRKERSNWRYKLMEWVRYHPTQEKINAGRVQMLRCKLADLKTYRENNTNALIQLDELQEEYKTAVGARLTKVMLLVKRVKQYIINNFEEYHDSLAIIVEEIESLKR
jgi:hypothetical protein